MINTIPTNRIINLLNSTTNKIFEGPLKIDIPVGTWHTLNHSIILLKYRYIYRFNPKINLFNLKGIMAFLITLYEYDSFSKIMVTVGMPQHSESSQIDLYSRFSQYYIIRWLPGMLTSRYIMARDFVRATEAKSSIVRYNLKYMRTTVHKLYQIPDLLILTTMNGIGSIIAKEAVIMKLPTIGIASNESFPEKIAFRFFGNIIDLRFIRSFLCIIGLGMRVGRELGITNNFLSSPTFQDDVSLKRCDLTQKLVLSIDQIKYDLNLDVKSFVINHCFEDFKLNLNFLSNVKLLKFKQFYKNLNFKVGKSVNELKAMDFFSNRFFGIFKKLKFKKKKSQVFRLRRLFKLTRLYAIKKKKLELDLLEAEALILARLGA